MCVHVSGINVVIFVEIKFLLSHLKTVLNILDIRTLLTHQCDQYYQPNLVCHTYSITWLDIPYVADSITKMQYVCLSESAVKFIF